MLTVQGGPVETKVGTGRTVSELSQIGCRHTPASEFPIEHQQSRGGGRLADAQILVHKISMHECPRHKITDSFDFFPQRFDQIDMCSDPAKHRSIQIGRASCRERDWMW